MDPLIKSGLAVQKNGATSYQALKWVYYELKISGATRFLAGAINDNGYVARQTRADILTLINDGKSQGTEFFARLISARDDPNALAPPRADELAEAQVFWSLAVGAAENAASLADSDPALARVASQLK